MGKKKQFVHYIPLPNGNEITVVVSATGRNVMIYSGLRFVGEFQTRKRDNV